MVDDMFQIVVDPFIPPSASYQSKNVMIFTYL
jgi:hypothetical protein